MAGSEIHLLRGHLSDQQEWDLQPLRWQYEGRVWHVRAALRERRTHFGNSSESLLQGTDCRLFAVLDGPLMARVRSHSAFRETLRRDEGSGRLGHRGDAGDSRSRSPGRTSVSDHLKADQAMYAVVVAAMTEKKA